MWIRSRVALLSSVVLGLFAISGCAADASGEPVGAESSALSEDVNESQLVPLLSPTFSNWVCRNTGRGPVCTGDRLRDFDWALTDFPCADPVYNRFYEYRTQTRNYNTSYLQTDNRFHQRQVDYFSLSPDGSDHVTITASNNWTEVFVTPGDDENYTKETRGVYFVLKSSNGGVLYTWTGSLTETCSSDDSCEIVNFAGNARSSKSLLAVEDIDLAIITGVCEALGSTAAL